TYDLDDRANQVLEGVYRAYFPNGTSYDPNVLRPHVDPTFTPDAGATGAARQALETFLTATPSPNEPRAAQLIIANAEAAGRAVATFLRQLFNHEFDNGLPSL